MLSTHVTSEPGTGGQSLLVPHGRMLPQIYQPPTPMYHYRALVAVVFALVLLVVLLGMVQFSSDASATIILTPMQHTVPTHFSESVSVREIHATSPVQQETSATTGTVHQSAQAAKGFLTLYNGAPFAIVVAAGTTITTPTGVTLVLDASRTVPQINFEAATAGYVTVPAHSEEMGMRGNVGAYAIRQVICCTDQVKNGDIRASNTSAFVGGMDETTYHVVRKSDIEQSSSLLLSSLTMQAQTALRGLLASGEQLSSSTPVCTPTVKANRAVGSTAEQVTVFAQVYCQGTAYKSYTSQQARADTLRRESLHPTFPIPFVLTGVSILAIQAPLVGTNGAVILQVTGEEHWVYQWNYERTQRLARVLAGMSTEQAQNTLTHLEGVALVPILQRPFWARGSLPTDAHNITITVSPV